jgi:hypothetical protein
VRKQAQRKEQARRLWLGWEHDDEDTVTILPADEDDPPPRAAGEPSFKRALALGAVIAVVGAVAFALISGGSNGSLTQGFGGPEVTGPDAVNAAGAAVAVYPGSVERVTRDPAGAAGYLVHVIQADGSEVHVLVSPHLQVEGSDASGGPNSFGRGSTQ